MNRPASDLAASWRRHVVGATSIVMLTVGISGLWIPALAAGLCAILIKVGTFLAVFWLAYPQLNRIPWWGVLTVLIAGLILAVRPRMAIIALRAGLVLLPVLLLVWVLRPRLWR